jgi:hypothetical protein
VDGGESGLDRFKAGWANASRPKYFVGRIFDHAAYEHLARERGVSGTSYFPAYRAGEF